MATVTRYPTGDVAVSGTWTTPTNVQADDGNTGSITRGTTKNSSDDREQTNYNFDAAIPAGSTINSVAIEVEHRVGSTSNICFLENLAIVNSVNGAVNSDNTEPTTLTAQSYTSYARPGGGSWTRDDLLNANFKTRIRARNGNNATSNTWHWDYIRVVVDYNPPAAEYTQTHNTDVYAYLSPEKTHTTDGLLQGVISKTHQTDAYVATTGATYEKQHTADALKYLVSAKTHTTDALKYLTPTKTHAADALKFLTSAKAHATDSFLAGVKPGGGGMMMGMAG